jgi:alcohol dehydrogenase
VIAGELEIYGSHGMQAVDYPKMLKIIASGAMDPSRLVSDTVSLSQGAKLLTEMATYPNQGITVIDILRG